jgi:hypothetical protein
MNFLIAVILPFCFKNEMPKMTSFFSMPVTFLFLVLALGCAMTGESNSDSAEKVFILAHPIKKSTYL